MRVSGGSAKGRTLKVAPGTRPTTDRVRQAMFNTLASLVTFEGRCLDLYAGSGALGIEALSRGVSFCDFVDSRRAACEAIRTNLGNSGLIPKARVICKPVAAAVQELPGPYAMVFADPPYADMDALAPINELADRLESETVLVVEHWGRKDPPPVLGGLALLRSKRYGDSAITFYGRGE